jgi:ABC-type histidine transport system ATPase subunit
MKALVTLIVEAILNWLWKMGLEAHKKQIAIQLQKEGSKQRSNLAQHELAVYKDILEEALTSDLDPEVIDELLIQNAADFITRLNRL